jgi:serine/threonine protein kinase
VTDVVGVQGAPALVMDVIRGPSLEQNLLARRPTWGQADALGRGILAGVRAAHQAGRIHRDLKPANVLLEVEDDQVVPKVADFGLAKILDSQNGMDSRTGVLLGTPAYMAPEQYRNAKGVDHRADIFSLGALLYELVTGMTPYAGTDIMELFDSIQGERYTPPRGLVSGLPERMDAAICKALSPLPDARPQSVDALLELWTGGSVAPVGVWTRANCDDLLSMGLQYEAPRRTGSETYVFDDGRSSEGLVERLVTAAPPPPAPVLNSDTLSPEPEPALPAAEPEPESDPEPERSPGWIPWAIGAALLLGVGGIGLFASGVLQPEPTPALDPAPAATSDAPLRTRLLPARPTLPRSRPQRRPIPRPAARSRSPRPRRPPPPSQSPQSPIRWSRSQPSRRLPWSR